MRTREIEPPPDELFALSRARIERFEAPGAGCLTSYRVAYRHEMIETWECNMLNALERAAGDRHSTFDITFHSPTRWTCRHRTHGYVLKVWGWMREPAAIHRCQHPPKSTATPTAPYAS